MESNRKSNRKLNKKVLIIPVVAIFGVIILSEALKTGENTISQLKRPEYNGTEESYSLIVKDGGGKKYSIDIPVSAKTISEDNLQACFDKAFEIVCESMPGENESLKVVRSDLKFVEEVEEYGIKVDYTTDNYELISCFGEVTPEKADEDGTICEITATLEYNDLVQSYIIKATVFPPEYSEDEKFVNNIISDIKKQNSNLTDEEYLVLPDNVDGKDIVFVQEEESNVPLVIVLIVLAFLVWYYKKFIVKRNQEKARELQMQTDYSEIVSKLSLLMGAGMSGIMAFNKIASDYKSTMNNNKGDKRYAYEEIVLATNRIASGISESEAYAIFGRSCRIHCYVKLGSILTQNVKKGGEGFIEILKSEATEAFIERKALARKAGEEAGTKLLLPMGLMLCVVMVVIIVPAFMSF